jgi:hypothetical protein
MDSPFPSDGREHNTAMADLQMAPIEQESLAIADSSSTCETQEEFCLRTPPREQILDDIVSAESMSVERLVNLSQEVRECGRIEDGRVLFVGIPSGNITVEFIKNVKECAMYLAVNCCMGEFYYFIYLFRPGWYCC